MFHMPMSSPMMTRMLGCLAVCAALGAPPLASKKLAMASAPSVSFRTPAPKSILLSFQVPVVSPARGRVANEIIRMGNPRNRFTLNDQKSTKSIKAQRCGPSLEKLHRRERHSRPWAEAIESELCGLSGLHVHEDVIVFLFRARALPIQIKRVALGYLDMGSTGKDRILFSAAAAQQQVPFWFWEKSLSKTKVQCFPFLVLAFREVPITDCLASTLLYV